MNRISASLGVVALCTALFSCSEQARELLRAGRSSRRKTTSTFASSSRATLKSSTTARTTATRTRTFSLTTQRLACLRSGATAPRSGSAAASSSVPRVVVEGCLPAAAAESGIPHRDQPRDHARAGRREGDLHAAHDHEQDHQAGRYHSLGRRLRRHLRKDRERLAFQVAGARVARDKVDRQPCGHAATGSRERVNED